MVGVLMPVESLVITISLVTFSPLSTTAFFDSSNSAPAGCVMLQYSNESEAKLQIEPFSPSAVTVALLISNFPFELYSHKTLSLSHLHGGQYVAHATLLVTIVSSLLL